jgi:hypothetical protein
MEDSRRNNIGLWQERNDFMIWPDILRARIHKISDMAARDTRLERICIVHKYAAFSKVTTK